uniref:TWiK family of potassium channels protein 7 n=1 Tax=Cacopsylla melanoneura TaxID=428564 RepID=A0A8D9AX77_9HEMI
MGKDRPRRSSSRSRSRQPERSFTEKCKDYLRQFLAFLFSNIGIICLVIGYTIAGAFIFIEIERDEHDRNSSKLRLNMTSTRNTTVSNLWHYTCCVPAVFDEMVWKEQVSKELKGFQHIVIDNVQKGYEGNRNSSNRWSFSGAFLYSLTVITTIGYGNLAPLTVLGKLATIVYAIAGMPLFLLYLSNIGDILAKSFKWIYAKCCLCRGCPTRARDLRRAAKGAGGKRRRSVAQRVEATRRWNVRNDESEFEDSDVDSSDQDYESGEEEEEEEKKDEEKARGCGGEGGAGGGRRERERG